MKDLEKMHEIFASMQQLNGDNTTTTTTMRRKF